MNTTRPSLLLRVRDLNDGEAWREFCEDYAPLLYRYARSLGLGHADAEEVRDACLALLTQRMPVFEYAAHRGRFKTWLYQIVRGKVVDTLRRYSPATADTGMLAAIRDPADSPDHAFERLWRERLLKDCLDRACASVSRRDALAFRLLLEEDRAVEDVCARLEMNANQVYKAKSRVLARVRELMLADDEE
jgi:RNA polymerase sigma-70 factor (ECF subfamily)